MTDLADRNPPGAQQLAQIRAFDALNDEWLSCCAMENRARQRISPAQQRSPRRARSLRTQKRIRSPGPRHPRRIRRVGHYQQGARSQLQRFRQGSALAVALTALLLLIWGLPGDAPAQERDAPAAVEPVPLDPAVSLEQAATTLRELVLGFYGFLPKVALALILLVIAAGVSRLVKALVQRVLGRWERSEAISALASIGIYLLAIGAILSVLAGDVRALVGSLGLLGLALSWALQTPIESFAGWVMNSFRNLRLG
jgi:small conductance mechanosensitive channel